MSTPCRESELDALLAGELPPEEAHRVSAHAATCATCTRALAWLRAERGWMAQRARRMPSRPALSFEALEARLRPPPVPRQARREHRGGLVAMMGAAATVAFMALSMLPRTPPSSLAAFSSLSSEDAWSEGLVSIAQVPACMDPSVDAVARVEARFGACLLASPAQPLP